MKLIYHSPPAAATFDVPREQNPDGHVDGYLTFRVYVCDPGEELPPGHPVGRPLGDYRAEAGGPGKPIIIQQSPSSRLGTAIPRSYVVPESVLANLPDDTLVRFSWHFGTDKASTAP